MKEEKVKEAARLFADFNTFASIKAMLEGGVIYSNGGLEAAEIVIGSCDDAMKSLLAEYDRKREQP